MRLIKLLNYTYGNVFQVMGYRHEPSFIECPLYELGQSYVDNIANWLMPSAFVHYTSKTAEEVEVEKATAAARTVLAARSVADKIASATPNNKKKDPTDRGAKKRLEDFFHMPPNYAMLHEHGVSLEQAVTLVDNNQVSRRKLGGKPESREAKNKRADVIAQLIIDAAKAQCKKPRH